MNHSTSIPDLGSYWEGQGGFRIGEAKDNQGRIYDLVAAADANRKVILTDKLAWGHYGTKISGADNFTDGLANANALLAAGSELVSAAAAVKTGEGHQDCYPASVGELNIFRATCPELIPEEDRDWFWSSTQASANHAWSQYFASGFTTWTSKDTRLRAVVVRRVYR